MNIVVVEDVPMVRERIVDVLLELEDMMVVGEADSVESALSKIEASQPDVVLLDISLPSHSQITNGIGVLKWVKQIFPAMHVVMLTNNASHAYSEACQRAGAFILLDKSNDFEKLPAVMAQLSELSPPGWLPEPPLQKQTLDQAQTGFDSEQPRLPGRDTNFAVVWLGLLVSICYLVAQTRRNEGRNKNIWRPN